MDVIGRLVLGLSYGQERVRSGSGLALLLGSAFKSALTSAFYPRPMQLFIL